MKERYILLSIGLVCLLSLTLFISCSQQTNPPKLFPAKKYASFADFHKLTKNVDGKKKILLTKVNSRSKSALCGNIEEYEYDPAMDYAFDMKTIRVNFHFINSLDSTQNFNPDKGVKYAHDMIKYANEKLTSNKKMVLPVGNDTPIDPIRFRYKLSPDASIPGDDGIYFHYVKDPFFTNHGRKKNNYSRQIIESHAVNLDSVLNIFYMVHPQDSSRSKTYRMKEAGIALGNAIKLGVDFNKPTTGWKYSGLLNHEIGHVFSLSHTWSGNDGCDDTPNHPNCWNTAEPPCDGAISNNVMDYNSQQNSYSPCQIAKVYKTLSRRKGKKRNLVKKDWCELDETKTITISDTTYWTRYMDIKGDIIIEKDALLYISCSVGMPKDGEIVVKKGGELVLHKATLYNDCNDEWNGIKIPATEDFKGKLSYIDTFYVENISYDDFYPIEN